MSGIARLIALAGVSGAGKDAAGEHLVRGHGYERVAFADPLKHAMAELFGLTREQLWGALRDVPDPHLGRTPRELYQRFGGACRDIDSRVWVRAFERAARPRLLAGDSLVCTDVRTRAELDAVASLGGETWLIERSGAGAPGAMARDVTEPAIATLPADAFRHVLRNDGTLRDLHARIDSLLAGRCGA